MASTKVTKGAKKPVKKTTTKRETTKASKHARSYENKLHIYAGFILGLLSTILFVEVLLAVYFLCM